MRSLVIDGGSECVRVGLGGDKAPKYYIRQESHVVANHPIEHGCVTNWDDMESLLQHTFADDLKVDPSGRPVLYIENPLVKGNREKITQIMFEKFHVQTFYVGISSVMSLYSAGMMDGFVLEAGHDQVSFVPVNAGYPIKEKMKKTNLAGRELTKWMQKLQGNDCDFLTAKELKENFSDLALDKEDNGFKCPELLFSPQMNGFEVDGIDKILSNSINECDNKIQNRLYSNILLAGGTSLIKGFNERIKNEITRTVSETTKIEVISHQDPLISSWVGGSIFISLEQFKQISITSNDYQESGPAIALTKCV